MKFGGGHYKPDTVESIVAETENKAHAIDVIQKADSFFLIALTKDGLEVGAINCMAGRATDLLAAALSAVIRTAAEIKAEHERRGQEE